MKNKRTIAILFFIAAVLSWTVEAIMATYGKILLVYLFAIIGFTLFMYGFYTIRNYIREKNENNSKK